MENIHKIGNELYIISDEEIKDDWCYDEYNKVLFKNTGPGTPGASKKIILTTDQELIADGVQPIDDEFLEWFVKNPNCEFIDVKKQYITPLGDVVDFCYDNERLNYKIIIPQEEPKQETLEEAINRIMIGSNIPYDISDELIKMAEWQAKRMYSEEEVRELLLIQRGNSYVAILTKTKDKELAAIASTAPEPGGKDGWVKQFKNK